MSYELFYTSAPRGLQRTSSGFCTVAATEGMPALLVDRLEQLSSYQPIFHPGSGKANPVLHAHWRLVINGRPLGVLSRICAAGLDHTRRPNKFAYHLVLESGEQPEGGPAWALLQPGAMETAWIGQPRRLPPGKIVRGDDIVPRACSAWAAAAGDAGWGGVLAGAFLLDPFKPAHLICSPAFDPLPLLAESLALIPPPLRWQVTFNTCFSELPAGLHCTWRCVRTGTPAAMDLYRQTGLSLILDLTRPLGPAPAFAAATMGREGKVFTGILPPASGHQATTNHGESA